MSLVLCLTLALGGCHTLRTPEAGFELPVPPEAMVPRELAKVSLPPYVIEPPDILLIDAVKVVPKPPYRIEALDILFIQAGGVLPDAPIAGNFPVEPGGRVNLGPSYGSVQVVDLTLEEAQQAIVQHLTRVLGLRQPEVSIQLAQSAGEQQIVGEHLVALDGQVNLGKYGSVYVAGMTLAEAKLAIEAHLAQFLDHPEVSVDVFAYNSKVYYVITEGAGQGDQVQRFPITGSETVLDAISNVGGIAATGSKNIWIARPTPGDCDQILPVNWYAIARGGSAKTNYQLLPGDRILIREDTMIATDSFIDKALNPFERLVGFTLLGTQTVQTVNRFPEGFRQGQGFF